MQKNYDPKLIEEYHYNEWERKKLFQCNQFGSNTFTIMLPPPNITGCLHMGHGFQQTLIDLLARYYRMMGKDVLLQPGTDHAGIATQMIVERHLNSTIGEERHHLSHDDLLKKIWQWKESSSLSISQQMRRLGISADWSRERFTMDQGFSQGVQECFIRLYEDGLIYRDECLVNWDPSLATAVSDLEVMQEEESGLLWYFSYPLFHDHSIRIEIATTRPETILGDTAVAVNPKDDRYQYLIGKHVKLPLMDRRIPIIADDYVDKNFATGCVKITPGHDFNDYEIAKRHSLPIINIFTSKGKIKRNLGHPYNGLDRFEAREKIVSDMKKRGLLVKVEPYVLKVPRSDRTGVVLEPYLTKQWFVKTKKLAESALKAAKDKRIKFIPSNWKNTYFSWLNSIQDWCISRQLLWGHRIPAWYDNQGHIYVGKSKKNIQKKYQIPSKLDLFQEKDVFDTWFSSALWPLCTLGWPEQTKDLKRYYPTNVLATGFDIIFFWVARMVMFGLHFMNETPFQDIYITGLIRDAEGKKMSKSQGNVLDPVDLIDGISLEQLLTKRTKSVSQFDSKVKIKRQTCKDFPVGIEAYGADALRITFAALASASREICFDISRMKGYRNFCNKLWNASRFVIMNVKNYSVEYNKEFNQHNIGIAEAWIFHELNNTICEVHKNISNYRFDLLVQSIFNFVWHQYCSWYLEFAKVLLNDPSTGINQKLTIRYTLVTVLDKILKIAHPIIPFITEEIFQEIKTLVKNNTTTSIMVSKFPSFHKDLINKKAAVELEWLKCIITSIRIMRIEMNIKPGLCIPVFIKNVSDTQWNRIMANKKLIQGAAKVSDIWNKKEPGLSMSSVVGTIELHIPFLGSVNIASELLRLKKEKIKVSKEISYLSAKLDNTKFVSFAPRNLVSKTKEKLAEYKKTIEKIKQQLKHLEQLI